MNLFALMPVRNEGWVLGLSARVALCWCDHIILLNHASTDNTAEIIGDLAAEYPGRVSSFYVPEEQWNEMQHRQQMLNAARERGADLIAIVDADEILTANLAKSTSIISVPMQENYMLQLPGYNLRGSLHRYHANGTWGRRWFSVAFKDAGHRFRWWPTDARGGETYHRREGFGPRLEIYRPTRQGAGGVMHLWGVCERRLRAKHALYKMVERIRGSKPIDQIEREYNWWRTGIDPATEPHTWQFADVPDEWWTPYGDWLKYLDLGVAPWQEAECSRLIEQHGPQMFRGLDLFGVV